MENWQLEFEWLRIRHFVKDALNREELPDLNTVLLLIGIQELGQVRKTYTKEEKQDLMHIAVCTLLSQDGIFEFIGRDGDGWPHFKKVLKLDIKGEKAQEDRLKILAIQYFDALQNDTIDPNITSPNQHS